MSKEGNVSVCGMELAVEHEGRISNLETRSENQEKLINTLSTKMDKVAKSLDQMKSICLGGVVVYVLLEVGVKDAVKMLLAGV
nr:hypothetical protein 4 [Deltaproteobacteria bacterium]